MSPEKSQDARSSILYIEDNPANLRLVEEVIKIKTNYVFLSAIDPREGLTMADKYKPNLILLDINLPGMDGYAVLEELQKNIVLREIPVIAVSADAMVNDLEKGIAAGFSDYIPKPINILKLINTIDTFMNKSS